MIVRLVVNQHCRLGWWFEREYFSYNNRDLRDLAPKNGEKYCSGGEHGVSLLTDKGDEIRAWLELVKETYPVIEEEIGLLLKEIGNSKGGFYDMRKILRDRKPSLLWRWSPLNKDFLPPSVFN